MPTTTDTIKNNDDDKQAKQEGKPTTAATNDVDARVPDALPTEDPQIPGEIKVYTGNRDAGRRINSVPDKLPEGQKLLSTYIPSKGLETKEKTVDGKKRKFAFGCINSNQHFEVECDTQVELPLHIAQVFKHAIEK